MKRIVYQIAFIVLVSSCVPIKKFQELQKQNQTCESIKDSLNQALNNCKTQNTELEDKNALLSKDISDLSADTSAMGERNRSLFGQNKKLNELNTSLIDKQSKLIQDNSTEMKKMLQEIQLSQEKLQNREDELNKLQKNLEIEKINLENLKKSLGLKDDELSQKDKQLQELQTMLKRKDSLTNALKAKIVNALLGFEGNGLSIEQRNGKIYVLLEEDLLFKVGKYEVGEKGKQALIKLASVLEKNPDINIMIEGHTDNTGGEVLNWNLSTDRALAITYILLQNSKIDPKRITASGRGQYSPIDNANTTEARQKNRRSEIILSPKLDELYDLLNSN